MISWLIALAILILLLWMKVGASVKWGTLDAAIKVRVGLLRFTLWPGGKPRKKSSRKQGKPAESVSSLERQERSILKKWLVALWGKRYEILELLGKALDAPTVDRLSLHVTVGNPDPAACAIEYGTVCAAIGSGLALLSRMFPVRKQEVDVKCRYDLPQTHTEGEVEVTIRVYLLIALCVSALRHFLQIYQSTKTTEKAVQDK